MSTSNSIATICTQLREFEPTIYAKHQTICQEIKDIRRRMRREFRAMNTQQKEEYMEHRNRFKGDYHNHTLDIQGLSDWAKDCYEPVNIRDNGMIQLEWRRDHLQLAPVEISYE
jgi:Ni/Co efflux regulator RcnB